MPTLLMNDAYPCFCEALQRLGYVIIPTKKIDCFHQPEQRHADMQCLRIDDTFFALQDCQSPVGRDYPANVRLNCLYLGGKLYGNLKAVDPAVLAYCRHHHIDAVHVNQGYTRCSALVLHDRAVITADKSIEKALQKNGVEVLLIAPGHIRLEGFDYGFIGGAGFAMDSNVYFFGNITKHPDYANIKAFCEKNQLILNILCGDLPLTDIGGVVLQTESD